MVQPRDIGCQSNQICNPIVRRNLLNWIYKHLKNKTDMSLAEQYVNDMDQHLSLKEAISRIEDPPCGVEGYCPEAKIFGLLDMDSLYAEFERELNELKAEAKAQKNLITSPKPENLEEKIRELEQEIQGLKNSVPKYFQDLQKEIAELRKQLEQSPTAMIAMPRSVVLEISTFYSGLSSEYKHTYPNLNYLLYHVQTVYDYLAKKYGSEKAQEMVIGFFQDREHYRIPPSQLIVEIERWAQRRGLIEREEAPPPISPEKGTISARIPGIGTVKLPFTTRAKQRAEQGVIYRVHVWGYLREADKEVDLTLDFDNYADANSAANDARKKGLNATIQRIPTE